MNPSLKAKAVPHALEPAWPASVYVVAGPDPPSPAAANAKRTFTPGLGSVWPRSSLDSRSAASAVLVQWAPRFASSGAFGLCPPSRQPCREDLASLLLGRGSG